ncbi:3'-5' exonuclease [Xanthomonas euroxanthea]|uniref:3'-5' exonuclease n=1 Tax=Xanthomonas euroxanthea TaxID=2259622 RepID=UPI0021A935D5|nr:3'-5' exonuclease [Xanthomonas euroxanthea]
MHLDAVKLQTKQRWAFYRRREGIRSDGSDAYLLSDLTARALLRTAELPGVLTQEENRQHLFEGEPAVMVLTMHSSKGLEFESVFIPGICEIGQRLQADSEEMRQEAELLYVAMTRALGSLTMLHHSETVLTERIGQAVDQIRARLAA